jgi:hypothetical protein
MARPFYFYSFHQPVQFGKQYKSWSYSLYNTFPPSVTSPSLYLTSPQLPHNNKHCVQKIECKTLSLEVPFCFLFTEWLMIIRYTNVAIFMIWSLTYHSSRHINIEKDTTRCTTDLRKPKSTNFYHMDQLCLVGIGEAVWSKTKSARYSRR